MRFGHTRNERIARRDDPYARARRRRARERHDASGGWELVYRDLAVPIPDGGEETLPSPGARARDREDSDGGEVFVVETHPSSRADNWHLEALDGDTVFMANQSYPPWSLVVEGVYVAELEAKLDGWRSLADVRDAVSLGAVRKYAFPAARLAPADRPDVTTRERGGDE
jgi:hypothetical protein